MRAGDVGHGNFPIGRLLRKRLAETSRDIGRRTFQTRHRDGRATRTIGLDPGDGIAHVAAPDLRLRKALNAAAEYPDEKQ